MSAWVKALFALAAGLGCIVCGTAGACLVIWALGYEIDMLPIVRIWALLTGIIALSAIAGWIVWEVETWWEKSG